MGPRTKGFQIGHMEIAASRQLPWSPGLHLKGQQYRSNSSGWRLALQQEEQEKGSSPQPIHWVGLRKQRLKQRKTNRQRKMETKKS